MCFRKQSSGQEEKYSSHNDFSSETSEKEARRFVQKKECGLIAYIDINIYNIRAAC